jgi:hypothetical protein
LSHQNGKNKNKKQRKKKTKLNIPRSNAIHFHLVLQHAVVVLLLSHQRKRKKKVWRQLCECLSEAHLPPTVRQLLLQALFISDLRIKLYPHLALQALFI